MLYQLIFGLMDNYFSNNCSSRLLFHSDLNYLKETDKGEDDICNKFVTSREILVFLNIKYFRIESVCY